jgi:nitrate/TMAO reductase-like tetraheme cytochrome c subunit
VPCKSCHYELIQGEGEIKEEGCKTCHDMPDVLARANDKKLMHEQHVAQQNAECFDCHRPIKHERMEFLDPVRESCFVCHPDHHKYQKLLLLGDKRKNVMNVPGLMYDVKTNCIGCHTEEKIQNGEAVLHGSVNTCVACHTPKHDKMVKEWIDKTNKELEYAREVEKEAITAIANAKSRVSPEKLNRAVAMLREGQENLRIVQYGGGVHNKKYSVVLLDAALNNFDDLIDLLGTVKDKTDT